MAVNPTDDKLDMDEKFMKQVQRMVIDNGDTLNNCINLMIAEAMQGIIATNFDQTTERERMYNQIVAMQQFSAMIENMVNAVTQPQEDE